MNEKAVAVAKDVLAQLALKRITPMRNYYLRATIETVESIRGKNLHEYTEQLQECKVCAIGACMLAKARLYNDVTIDDRSCSDEFRVAYGADKAHAAISSIFGEQQRLLMEVAFEGEVPPIYSSIKYYISPDDRDAAIAFGKKSETDEERLMSIMSNIIDNAGEFKV